jgi:hypothetical protein
VTFWVKEGATRVRCRIAREALDDHFLDAGRFAARPPHPQSIGEKSMC